MVLSAIGERTRERVAIELACSIDAALLWHLH
jgi:hypothetical protein